VCVCVCVCVCYQHACVTAVKGKQLEVSRDIVHVAPYMCLDPEVRWSKGGLCLILGWVR